MSKSEVVVGGGEEGGAWKGENGLLGCSLPLEMSIMNEKLWAGGGC
jgi:hypothetical protein